MDIDPQEAVGSVEYEGESFSFCSDSCKQAFEADPARYVKESPDR